MNLGQPVEMIFISRVGQLQSKAYERWSRWRRGCQKWKVECVGDDVLDKLISSNASDHLVEDGRTGEDRLESSIHIILHDYQHNIVPFEVLLSTRVTEVDRKSLIAAFPPIFSS